MPEKDKTNSDSGKGNQNGNHAPHADLYRVVVAAGIVFAALLFGSIFIPNLTERIKFFTVNALSLLVLVAIVVQAYIYRRQWEVMRKQSDTTEHQLTVMRESLIENQNIIKQNERGLRVAEQNSKIAQKSMVYTLRAYLSISGGRVEFEGNDVSFLLYIENSGKTPANNVLIHIILEVAKPPVNVDETDDGNVWPHVGTIGPSHSLSHRSASLRIAPSDRVLIETKKLGLYCRGTILYDDIFGEERRSTQFGFVYRPPGNAFGPVAGANKAD